MDLRSKKAIYVRQQAPEFCHIQFVCKEHLIHTRFAMSYCIHDADVCRYFQKICHYIKNVFLFTIPNGEAFKLFNYSMGYFYGYKMLDQLLIGKIVYFKPL